MNKADTRWLAFAFFLSAILMRFLPHWPNFTPVAAMALFAGCYLSGVAGIVFAFGAMAASDFIGNYLGIAGIYFYDTTTMLSVYVALGLSALVGRILRGHVHLATVPLASLAGTTLFFLITNFASWRDPMMAYPQTLAGLGQCYLAAVPFAQNSLLGDLFFSAILFGSYALATHRSKVSAPAAGSTH
tara:strand:+ start:226 stop:786 length:561 start_codon:yes stop_codon:yes gene_type:complete